MPEWKDLLAALASLIASFAGAWAAFGLESSRRKREEDEKCIGAANRALYTIYHYWNILEQLRSRVLEPLRGRPDAWLNLPAHPAAPASTDRFQVSDLQFLLQTEHAGVFVALMLEEQRFQLAVSLVSEHSELVLNEVFPRMAKAGFSVGHKATPPEIEHALGIDVTHKLKQITAAMYQNVDEDLASLKEAHNKLRAAMKAIYPDRKFIQIVFEHQRNA